MNSGNNIEHPGNKSQAPHVKNHLGSIRKIKLPGPSPRAPSQDPLWRTPSAESHCMHWREADLKSGLQPDDKRPWLLSRRFCNQCYWQWGAIEGESNMVSALGKICDSVRCGGGRRVEVITRAEC